jgi:hypothetical protein
MPDPFTVFFLKPLERSEAIEPFDRTQGKMAETIGTRSCSDQRFARGIDFLRRPFSRSKSGF